MRRADCSLVGDTSVARIASDTSRITITVARSRGIGCVQTGLANAIARPVRLASVRKEAAPRRQRPDRRGGECVAIRKRSADRFLDSLVMAHARRIKGTARTPRGVPVAAIQSRTPQRHRGDRLPNLASRLCSPSTCSEGCRLPWSRDRSSHHEARIEATVRVTSEAMAKYCPMS